MNSRSWVQVVMKMKESPKEWDALPSLAWINQVIFKLKMDKEKKEKEYKEWIEKEEREKKEPKKEKEKKERKEERKENMKKQWDALPNTALLNIFCNTELKDRLKSLPLVCKSWKTVTDDPRCWYSMIPDSVSPEDAFIKKIYSFPYYFPYSNRKLEEEEDFLVGISCLFKEEGEEEEEEVLPVVVSRLRTLIKKSGGGAAITTLYLSPFTTCGNYGGFDLDHIDETYDKILHLIATCCPNLKHISFKVHRHTSMEVVLLLLNKCKKLELIELFYYQGGRFRDEEPTYSKLLESLSCLPNLYGFHFHRDVSYDDLEVATPIATHLPRLKLLRLYCEPLEHKNLSVILFSCLELQYLYVPVDRELYYNQDIIDQASVQIPEFYYQRDYYDTFDSRMSDHDGYSVLDEYSHSDFENHVSKKVGHASRIVNHDFSIDDYCDILKQRKEDRYVSMLKEKMNNKKKSYQCNSSLIKKKKKNSTMKKNKKDQCVYADYVIQSK